MNEAPRSAFSRIKRRTLALLQQQFIKLFLTFNERNLASVELRCRPYGICRKKQGQACNEITKGYRRGHLRYLYEFASTKGALQSLPKFVRQIVGNSLAHLLYTFRDIFAVLPD